MKRTYVKQFFGTPEAVEAGIRKFDQVLRRMYNVYGGRREASYMTSDGEYTVVMSYTADWTDYGGLFPSFRIEAINRQFNREADRLPKPFDTDFYCDVIKERT